MSIDKMARPAMIKIRIATMVVPMNASYRPAMMKFETAVKVMSTVVAIARHVRWISCVNKMEIVNQTGVVLHVATFANVRLSVYQLPSVEITSLRTEKTAMMAML